MIVQRERSVWGGNRLCGSALANDDDNTATNDNYKSTLSIMSGMSQISISDQSLDDAGRLFSL